MLPPQSQQHLNMLARQDMKEQSKSKLKKQNSQSSQMSLGSISIFQSEYDSNHQFKGRKQQSKRVSQITSIAEVNQSEEFATFGNDLSSIGDQKRASTSQRKNFDYKKFNQVFQDDLTYLIRYAVSSNANKYSISPGQMQKMKEEVQREGKKDEQKLNKSKEKKNKMNNFLERNYNKQFEKQQKIFNEKRELKKKKKEDDEQGEQFDQQLWKTQLALMKYQVLSDDMAIKKTQREKKEEYAEMDKQIDLVRQQREAQQKEEEKLKTRQRRGAEARTVSVKISGNETGGSDNIKKQIIKSDHEVEKDVRRLIAINSRQVEKDDMKINNYFIRIQRRLQILYKLQAGAEKEKYRDQIMTEIRDNEQIFKDMNDQIIGKYEGFLVESIIDDILLENVLMLEYIEKKQKLTKKQLRNAALHEYKQTIIDYFDEAQTAALNLVYVGVPKPAKVVYYENVFIETGYGLLLSALDNKNKFDQYRSRLDYSDKNNVALLNIIAKEITQEIVEEVAEKLDECTDEFTDQLFASEFS